MEAFYPSDEECINESYIKCFQCKIDQIERYSVSFCFSCNRGFCKDHKGKCLRPIGNNTHIQFCRTCRKKNSKS